MIDYITRTTQVTVISPGEPIFSKHATKLNLVDEAAGEFVEVEQDGGTIQITPDEWPQIRSAIEAMIAQCEDHK